jgi:hypothetical protein
MTRTVVAVAAAVADTARRILRRPECYCGWKGWTLRDVDAHQQVMHWRGEVIQHEECRRFDARGRR